jgi:hypothetical protein
MQTTNFRALLSASILLGLGTACGPGDVATIETTRDLGSDALTAQADATSAQRFGSGSASHEHAAPQQPSSPFGFTLPTGWTELAPAQQRFINLMPAGNPDAACYLTILGGNGGGMAANVNRWLGQLGLDPLDEAGIEALPTLTTMELEGTLVEGRGHFSGMDDQSRDDWGLLGLILPMQVPDSSGVVKELTAFVKMTGPGELLDAERANFEAFCKSLVPIEESTAPPAPAGPAPTGALTYAAPEGWNDVGASGMRLASLMVGDLAECYVIRLGGDGGGMAGNVNRWRGQLGLDPLDGPGLAALPKTTCLGTEAILFDATGSYTGMNGEKLDAARMLGALVFFGDTSYFVKFVGPADVISAEAEHFQAFLASLELGS